MLQPKFLITLFICACCWASCGNNDARYIPDVSKVSGEVKIERFERDFFAIDSTNMAASTQTLLNRHPNFAPIFINDILGGRMLSDSILNDTVLANTRAFLSYPYSRWLYDTTQLVYPDNNKLQAEMQDLLRYYNYYFPKDSTPITKLYTFISVYKYGIIVMDDYVAVGLDFFLGEGHQDYMGVDNLRHAYVRRTLTPQHLPTQIASAIADDIVETASPRIGNKLVDHILNNGKKFYLTQCLTPKAADSLVYKFTNFQIEYCQKGEAGLYEHLAKEINLYSDKLQDFRGYVFEGPFKPENGLYGNSGSWLGAQIVTQFADRIRKELNQQKKDRDAQQTDILVIQRVLAETDPQEFLKRYKPKR